MNSPIFQTNTFTGGLNMDVDKSFIKDNQYRYAENIRLLTNDGGTTGVVQGIEGIEKLIVDLISTNEVIIGAITIKEYAVVFTKEYTLTGVFNRIWKYDFTQDKKDPTITLLLSGYFNISNELSLVANYTSDTNIKVYFADGDNLIRVINIMEVITDPNFNIGALDIVPSAVLPSFKVVSLGIGSLPSGVIQYCYQLFNLYGNESSTSSLSTLIPLSDSGINDDYSYGQSKNQNSNKSVILKTDIANIGAFNKCRIISIHYSSNTALPTISIVNEVEIGSTDTFIQYEDKGNGYLSELTIEEFNSITGSQFAPLSIAKMDNRLFASNIKDVTWDIEYDARAYRRNSAGMVKLNSATGSSIEFNANSNPIPDIPLDFDCINLYNELKPSEFTTDNSYIYGSDGKRGGVGKNVSYSFLTADMQVENTVIYNVRTNSESNVVTEYRGADSAEFKAPSIYGNTLPIHTESGSSVMTITPTAYTSKKNYSDPLIAEKFRSYQRDEVYRFGIIFYNDKNIASPVHWIADIRMPHITDNGYNIFTTNRSVQYLLSKTYNTYVHPLGIQFTVNNIPTDVKAFEIVRCQRTVSDRTVLMQGALSNLLKYYKVADGVGTGTEVRPHAWLTYGTYMMSVKTAGSDHFWSLIRTNDNIKVKDHYTFTSPEVCYNKENINDFIKGDVYLDTLYGLASPINRWRPATLGDLGDTQYDAVMHGTPYIKTANGVLTDVRTNSDYYQSGELYSEFAASNLIGVHMPMGPHAILVSRYLLPFYTASLFLDQPALASITSDTFKSISKVDVNVDDIAYGTPLLWSDYTNETIKASGVSVGNVVFQNWSQNWNNDTVREEIKYGPHGYCLAIHSPELTAAIPGITQIGEYTTDSNKSIYNRGLSQNAILIANLKQNVIQYGGNTYASIQNSVYISTDTYTPRTSASLTVNCFNGDTYIGVLDYSTTMMFSESDASVKEDQKCYFGAYIPFESTINFAFKQDQSFSNTYMNNGYANGFLQNNATQFLTYHTQSIPPYSYNDAYSSQSGSKRFVAKGIYDLSNLYNSNRITCSLVKSGYDTVDQWTKFKFADYLDIDNQYGIITNLRVFNNKLYYWQNDAFGIASVNERSLVQDNNIGQLTLGTGGILARYDYITTDNGNSVNNDKSIVKSDSTIYWFDFNKNEIVAFGNNVHSLSKVKSVQSYLNEMPNNKKKNVVSYYDKKYNEVGFKIYDKTLIFNEQLDVFTSFYTVNPTLVLSFSDRYYTISDVNELYLHNTTDNLITDTYPLIKTSKIQFVVNKDIEYTKTFDNVFFSGDFNVPIDAINKDIVKDVWFETKYQTNSPIKQSDMDNREDTYRFAINREINDNTNNNLYNNSFLGRMKGKYLICNYSFDCTEGKTFTLPSIRTTYRYSLV